MAEQPKTRSYQGMPRLSEWGNARADLTVWNEEIDRRGKSEKVPDDVLASALRVVRRAAAIDTGAIEALYGVDRGFTLTVAMESAVWQAALAGQPERARSLIQAQLDAYERMLDIINGPWPITEAVVRALHSEVCKNQDTYVVKTAVGTQEHALPKGEYKTHPNNVLTLDGSIFEYCPPDLVSAEMHLLLQEVSSEEFTRAHPVMQAAWIHYAFVLIHPFADGNGRVARLLASLYLCKAASVPFLVFADEREAYFTALREADGGDHRSFVEFTARGGRNAFELIDASIRTARAPDPEESLKKLRGAYVTDVGLTYDELDSRATAFLKLVHNNLTAKLQAIQQSGAPISNVSFSTSPSLLFAAEKRRRAPQGFAAFSYMVQTRPPHSASAQGRLQLEMPRNAAGSETMLVRWQSVVPKRDPASILGVRVEEILEEDSPRLKMEIDVAMEGITRYILSDLALAAEHARKQG